MKKTQRIDLLTNIRKTWVSFLSIMLFVTLAIALFLGLSWSSKALDRSASEEYARYHTNDFELVYPYGFDEEAVECLGRLDGIDAAEGTYSDYVYFELNGTRAQAKLIGLTETVDQFSKTEGRLPGQPDELAVEAHWAELNGIRVGDTVRFLHDGDGTAHVLHQMYHGAIFPSLFENEDGMATLLNDTFTVTALVENPAYASVSEISYGVSPENAVPICCILYVCRDAFDPEAFTGYTNVLLHSGELNRHVFSSDEYKDGAASLKKVIEETAAPLTEEKSRALADAIGKLGVVLDSELKCTVLTREESGGALSLLKNSEASGSLCYSLASLLVVIGILVCYSTVSRIVQKQKVLLGTKKALGFSKHEITAFYMLYSGIATVLGAVLGILLARFVLEPVSLSQMLNNFVLQSSVTWFSVADALIMTVIELVVILLAAFAACFSALRLETLKLLVGEEPPVHKTRAFEKLRLWEKLPLITKTAVNNFFTNRMRVFATLVGIAGCTALVACGLSFRDAVAGILPYHYEKIQAYDRVVYCDASRDCRQAIEDTLSEYSANFAGVYTGTGFFRMPDGKSISSNLIVTDSENFAELFHILRPDKTEGRISDGVWIGNALAEAYGLSAGDKLQFAGLTGEEHTVTLDGICRYYGPGMILLMSSDTYEELFHTDYVENAFLLDTASLKGEEPVRLNQALNRIDGFLLNYAFEEVSRTEFRNISGTFTIVTVLYLSMSAAMAFMVVLNLLSTFVSEKKRELTVMMINGYSAGQVKKYIYGDTVFLTVIGSAAGLLIGLYIGELSIRSISRADLALLHEVNPMACVISVVFTALLVAVMSVISLKAIDHFELTDVQSVL